MNRDAFMAHDHAFQLPKRFKAALDRHFERIVVFSGAGMSADSGIPTFRGSSNGLWNAFDPQDLATPDGWRRNKELVWGWYEWRRGLVVQARPNPGHLAVGGMQRNLGASVVTQNVDDLHERGGAHDVLHLHGSIMAARCFACAEPYELGAPPQQTQLLLEPPSCPRCNDFIRPGVVWFGEALPGAIVQRAAELISACDLLLVVGTSGVVYPAAGMVQLAPPDAVIIEVNPAVTNNEGSRILQVHATAAVALPYIAGLLG